MKPKKGLPRAFDFTASLIGSLTLSPLLILTAIAVKATSKGPAFFRQKRVGKGGRDFILFKFRTMKQAERGLKITAGGDPRVTRLGRILRKTKIDELPQLWNVLMGDMALVGPRPEVRDYVELYPEQWAEILTVRPGISDPVTLKLRNEEELLSLTEDPADFYAKHLSLYKIGGYILYVRNRTAVRDLGILFRTLRGIFFPGMEPPPVIDDIYRGWKNGD